MTGLAALFARRPAHARSADVRCGWHGVQPRTYAGCMKCGAGTVATARRQDSQMARASTAEPSALDDAAALDDGDDDGWDAAW